MSWAINVSVVTILSLVLNGSGIDSNTSGLFFWGLIDLVIVNELRKLFLRENLGDSSSQGSLSVINMSNSTNIQMNFVSLELGKSLEW